MGKKTRRRTEATAGSGSERHIQRVGNRRERGRKRGEEQKVALAGEVRSDGGDKKAAGE